MNDCRDRDFDTNKPFFVTIHHELGDGWAGNWIKIFFDDNRHIVCEIHMFWLDDTSSYSTSCSLAQEKGTDIQI